MGFSVINDFKLHKNRFVIRKAHERILMGKVQITGDGPSTLANQTK